MDMLAAKLAVFRHEHRLAWRAYPYVLAALGVACVVESIIFGTAADCSIAITLGVIAGVVAMFNPMWHILYVERIAADWEIYCSYMK